MSDLHRKNYIAASGERFTLLVNEDGIPDFWTTLYTTLIKIIKNRTDLKLNTNIDYTNPNIYSKDWTSQID